MPVTSRKQYAEICGDDILKINMWIKRGKISTVPLNKKLIDTENAINAAFMADRRRFNTMAPFDGVVPEHAESEPLVADSVTKKVKSVKKVAKTVQKPPRVEKVAAVKKTGKVTLKQTNRQHKIVTTGKVEPREIKIVERKIAEQSARDERRVDQDMVKKGLEIENLELAKQQKLLQLNKSAGNLLPVDLVKGVLKRHGDTFFKSFEKSSERFLSIICGSDQETFVKHMAKMKDIFSAAIQDAGKQADAEILILVNDYSETLARGQKKI
jgi:hypothetical protein